MESAVPSAPTPTRARRHKCGRDDRGQAAVEVALALPVVFVAVLAVAQVLVVGAEQVALVHATREAARAASLVEDGDPAAAGPEAGRRASGPLDPERLTIAVTASGTRVTATGAYRATMLPIVGRLLGPRRLDATTVMGREP
jgi:Flp pilus assembly protein TadG